MDYQIKPLSFSEVRAIAARVIREEPTPNDLVQAARESLLVRCEDAALYGLTTADVVRALLRPVFEKRRSCDCPTCKARRDDLEEGTLRSISIPVM